MNQKERIQKTYETVRDNPDYDYQRVVYSKPYGNGWGETKGYTMEAEVCGEPFLKVIDENQADTVNVDNIVLIHVVEEPKNE